MKWYKCYALPYLPSSPSDLWSPWTPHTLYIAITSFVPASIWVLNSRVEWAWAAWDSTLHPFKPYNHFKLPLSSCSFVLFVYLCNVCLLSACAVTKEVKSDQIPWDFTQLFFSFTAFLCHDSNAEWVSGRKQKLRAFATAVVTAAPPQSVKHVCSYITSGRFLTLNLIHRPVSVMHFQNHWGRITKYKKTLI